MEYSLLSLNPEPFGNDIVQMILHAGPMVKFILLTLFCLSLFSWTIIFIKLKLIKKFKDENEKFLHLFSSSTEISKLYLATKKLQSPLALIFRAGYAEFNRSKKLQAQLDENNAFQSSFKVMDHVHKTVKRVLSSQTSRLEKGLTFLATAGNASPFIGLFGTVWGIMTSFRSIGMKGSASLAVVAPGIAEALIATAAGLAVAIPAVVAYNYFSRKTRIFQTESGNFIFDFIGLLERESAREAASDMKKTGQHNNGY